MYHSYLLEFETREHTRRHGGVELPGHGVGVVTSPVVYSSVFLKSRFDARDVLHAHRCRLETQPAIEWILDFDTLGLHRSVIVSVMIASVYIVASLGGWVGRMKLVRMKKRRSKGDEAVS